MQGLPRKETEIREETRKHPLTWEDVKDDVEKSKMNLDYITSALINGSELDFDNCNISEVIQFVQKMSKAHTSSLNIVFTEHINYALIKGREEKLRLEVSIPRKLKDD